MSAEPWEQMAAKVLVRLADEVESLRKEAGPMFTDLSLNPYAPSQIVKTARTLARQVTDA